MQGKFLKDINFTEELIPKYQAVKEAVLPFKRFPGSDTLLGPEMRSTGEVMGLAIDFGLAYAKSELAAGNGVPLDGVAFLSTNDLDKEYLEDIARELINLGFKDVYRFKNKAKQEYTFWDYFAGSWQKNYGMRIDHFLLSNSLIENIKSIKINKTPRSEEKPSDHTPIELEII